jgi:hypothetical protein
MTNLKCSPCTDQAITDGQEMEGVADAFTLAPVVQVFGVNGQQIAAPLALPVCPDCRKKQLATVSKSGLAIA